MPSPDAVSVPVTFVDLAIRLVIATVCGAAIGVNRELHVKPAGLRTHALMALGTAVVTVVSLSLSVTTGNGDPSAPGRVIQGILAGIGFIGGGAIFRGANLRSIHGLTTAMSVWLAAAIGISAGVGMWRTAVFTAALTLVVLTIGSRIDAVLARLRRAKLTKE